MASRAARARGLKRQSAGLPVSPDAVLIASGFAIFVGLAAGVYPSISASRLTPVEALRA